jgi:hypothetical protein
MNALLPCLQQSNRQTVQLNGRLRLGVKNWQHRWAGAGGGAGVSKPLDLDGTIFVPATN